MVTVDVRLRSWLFPIPEASIHMGNDVSFQFSLDTNDYAPCIPVDLQFVCNKFNCTTSLPNWSLNVQR